jgi:hypothetical protein
MYKNMKNAFLPLDKLETFPQKFNAALMPARSVTNEESTNPSEFRTLKFHLRSHMKMTDEKRLDQICPIEIR